MNALGCRSATVGAVAAITLGATIGTGMASGAATRPKGTFLTTFAHN